MKKYILTGTSALALLFATGCANEFDTDVASVKVSSGEADFSRFVSIGNSLTSGFRDGTLYLDGQNESFPSMIAAKMKLAGGGEFKQPLMPNNVGGFTGIPGFNGKLVLQVVNGALSPVASAPGAALDNVSAAGPYNNMGVPGAKSFHLVAPGYGNPANFATQTANPYFVRFASSANATVLGDAVAQKPTFFSLWIGNNDVLSYATSGGTNATSTPGVTTPATFQQGNLNPATYKSNDISDPQLVAGVIKQVLESLKSVGATKGVIANIPNVTSIPFFTTVPSKPIAGLTAEQISMLNTAYAKYNGGLALAKQAGKITDTEYQKRLVNFTAGANGAVIVDNDLTDLSKLGLPSYRQSTTEDHILLTTASALKSGGGTATALTDAQVLTAKETEKVLTATKAYNAAISSIASAYGLALVDANAKMTELGANSGIMFDGVKYTTTFVTGGAFSLDGVHLTGRGYAVIANEFIKSINSKYKSTLPLVSVNSYSGVTFP